MVTKEQINRINELAKKQKDLGLTEAEQQEQAVLRKLYVESFKESLRAQLKNVKVVTEEEYEALQKQEKCSCGHDHDNEHECNCGSHEHSHDKGCNCNSHKN